jgi:hypothetical protein
MVRNIAGEKIDSGTLICNLTLRHFGVHVTLQVDQRNVEAPVCQCVCDGPSNAASRPSNKR